ncbi:aldehyde dehydrogenase family protein [Marinobacterium sp. D7]|uniref:aldehyde dehydrogenase family protein n=1 Tax=Marinobacterium ramblicola TaxID=2849041 RepID=UPI001C2D1EBF|nr:aldehyde dehydrogenase family protein [Marinobacterium ramblicola]MBV1789950.1 aldehyde dehydrogenase family protein [Marinobacterium ramblicola]
MAIMDIFSDVQQFLSEPKKLFIGGEWVEPSSGEYFPVENPATGQNFAQVSMAVEADVDRAVAAARNAQEGAWAKVQPAERSRLMIRLAELIEADAENLGQIISLENGKPYTNAYKGEVVITANIIRYFAGWPSKIEGSTIPVSPRGGEPMLNYTLREPVGVCALIVPWNFPLSMCAWKLGPVLATGCTAVLKPAEQTPLVALRLAELIQKAGIPAGVVNVLTGFGDRAGAPLSAHDDVDKIAFTGSTGVGRMIAKAAAGNMKKVSLELGGKSPNIILPDADIVRAAKGSADGIFYNQGQVCTAASRLYVHESVLDQTLEELRKHAAAHLVGPGLDPANTMGPLVSREQHGIVKGYVDRALNEGAELICGGKAPAHLEGGYFMEPTVFLDRQEQACIAREEIFGPVVTVMSWSDVDELVHRANNTPFGLAAGVWTNNLKQAHTIAAKLKAGSVWINCWNVVDPASPFGGYKQSGWGREMGKNVIDAYTETKSVFVDLS